MKRRDRVKKIVVVTAAAFLMLWSIGVESREGLADFQPLLRDNELAQKSRIMLSGLLYEEGVRMERAGNLAAAVSIWFNAYNLDSANALIWSRMNSAYAVFLDTARRKYHEALLDIQYGRMTRARDGLRGVYDFLGGMEPDLSGKVISALSEVGDN